MTKVVEHDRDGVTTTIEYDESADKFIVGHHQDVAPILRHMQHRDTDGTGGWSPSRNYRLKASIPSALYNEWLIEAYKQKIPLYHKKVRDEFLKRKLADYKKLIVASQKGDRVGYGNH